MAGEHANTRVGSGPEGWRSGLLDSALTALTVALVVSLFVSVPLIPPPHFGAPTLAIAATAILAIAMRLATRLSAPVRGGVVATGTLVTALVVTAHFGFGPGVPVALSMIGAVLSIAFGRSAAVLYFAAIAGGLVLLGFSADAGRLPLSAVVQDPTRWVTWLRWALVFFASATALAYFMHEIVRRVEVAARDQIAAEVEHRRCAAVLVAVAKQPALESGCIEDAFAAIAEAGVQGLDVARAGVWLFEEDDTRLRCADQFERDVGHERGATITAGASPAYFDALTDGRTLAVDDARTDRRTRERSASYLEPRGITAMIAAPIRFRDRWVGVVGFEHVGARRTWSGEAQAFAASLADFASIALAAAERDGRERELREAYDLLGRLHSRVENAKEEERRHLARELHDELGQNLTALKLRLQIGSSATDLGAAITMVDGLIDRTRRISLDLRPPLLDEAGLAAAVRAYLESNAALARVQVALQTSGLEQRMAPELETAVFRVVQESLTNIVRHAGAQQVDVDIRTEDGHLRVSVRDDGCGFAMPSVARGGHFGLLGMSERVRGMGGTLDVESRPGAGTQVRARFPMAPPA
jgi:signal transduction histidine kinase